MYSSLFPEDAGEKSEYPKLKVFLIHLNSAQKETAPRLTVNILQGSATFFIRAQMIRNNFILLITAPEDLLKLRWIPEMPR